MKKKKLIIAASLLPFTSGNQEAANVITHQIIKNLIKEDKFEIYFCLISHSNPEFNKYSEAEVDNLKKFGVRFLPPLLVPKFKRINILKKIGYMITKKPDKIFSGSEVQDKIYSHFGFQPDLYLAILSELATHAGSKLKCKKFNYSGNSQHNVYAARYELSTLENNSNSQILGKLNFKLRHFFIKNAYLFALRKYDLIWNVACNDSLSLKKEGVNAKYLQNMWPTPVLKKDYKPINHKENSVLRIIANVGNMNATGNSLGLYVLATEILPRMKKLMKDKKFEFHLFGNGEPLDFLKNLLSDSHIKIRGFVKDLDKEIATADIFLVTNNSRRFKVCHTRFLHAWSLSACVVAFKDSSLAIPEIVNGYNALLGEDSEQICDLILKCSNNPKLQKQISQNGFKTLKTYFDPKKITSKLTSDIINNLN